MIATPDYILMMARYASWQNAALITAADTLSQADRTLDRGGFFGSIVGTLNHLLWGDRIWMSRFAATPAPRQGSITDSVRETADWEDYKSARSAQDTATRDWAKTVSADALAGDLTWYSGAAGREVSRPMGALIVHMFNHGTHHRGQVHAMLTAAGASTTDTDLFLMPKDT